MRHIPNQFSSPINIVGFVKRIGALQSTPSQISQRRFGDVVEIMRIGTIDLNKHTSNINGNHKNILFPRRLQLQLM